MLILESKTNWGYLSFGHWKEIGSTFRELYKYSLSTAKVPANSSQNAFGGTHLSPTSNCNPLELCIPHPEILDPQPTLSVSTPQASLDTGSPTGTHASPQPAYVLLKSRVGGGGGRTPLFLKIIGPYFSDRGGRSDFQEE